MTYQNRPQAGHQRPPQGSSGPSSSGTPLPPIDLQCPPDRFVKNAEDWASKWYEARATKSQVRRFYGEVRRLEQLIRPGDMEGAERWKTYELEFRMLKPKAAYSSVAAGKAPQALVSFIQQGVDKVKDVKDFEQFVKLFESVVGFAYEKGLGDRN